MEGGFACFFDDDSAEKLGFFFDESLFAHPMRGAKVDGLGLPTNAGNFQDAQPFSHTNAGLTSREAFLRTRARSTPQIRNVP